MKNFIYAESTVAFVTAAAQTCLLAERCSEHERDEWREQMLRLLPVLYLRARLVEKEELLSDEGQKLLFVFDMMNERSFFIELRETIPGMDLPMAKCTASKGTAPKQILDDLFADLAAASAKGGDASFGFEEDFNDDNFDEEELDDLNISDDYFSDQNF